MRSVLSLLCVCRGTATSLGHPERPRDSVSLPHDPRGFKVVHLAPGGGGSGGLLASAD